MVIPTNRPRNWLEQREQDRQRLATPSAPSPVEVLLHVLKSSPLAPPAPEPEPDPMATTLARADAYLDGWKPPPPAVDTELAAIEANLTRLVARVRGGTSL